VCTALPQKVWIRKKLEKEVDRLRKKMKTHATQLEFEEAAKIRDEVKRLQMVQLSLLEGDTDREMNAVIDGKDDGSGRS
jgi:excinuclease ABC subunit B